MTHPLREELVTYHVRTGEREPQRLTAWNSDATPPRVPMPSRYADLMQPAHPLMSPPDYSPSNLLARIYTLEAKVAALEARLASIEPDNAQYWGA